MDLQEWELLPDDGFLEIHDDGGNKIFSRKYGMDPVLKTNHFIYPSSPDSQKITDSRLPNQLVAVPIQLERVINKVSPDHEVLVKEIPKHPIDINIVSTTAKLEKIKVDQDTVSQVSFKKKETEFVDMKMDSPKSNSRAILPQIDAGMFHFVEKDDAYEGQAMECRNCSSKVKVEKEVATKKNNPESDVKKEVTLEGGHGFNLWKWSFTGIGAICSFGVAAATVCIFILGGHPRNKNQQRNQNLRFEIYANDKRIKQVVHHASKLNEAISAVRGVPFTRAHITVGGYYDGLLST